MARKKAAVTAEAPLADDLVEKVVVLLVTIRSRADVLRYCVTPPGDNERKKGLGLGELVAGRLIDEALRRIQLAAAIDHDLELGKAQTRLAELFQKANATQDYKTALAIQKELNRLQALYPGKAAATAPSAPDQDDDSEALAELAAARAHLAPLVDADEDDPLDEIARRVVGLFTSR